MVSASVTAHGSQARLPKLNLPTFNGDVTEWTTFGRPYGSPAPHPLPAFRVRQEPPFTFTGVDFAEPLFVKESSD